MPHDSRADETLPRDEFGNLLHAYPRRDLVTSANDKVLNE